LVQTDYRHLKTAASNAAFGYNLEGALQEFVILDERVIIDPATGERFLIPVSDRLAASAVALVEPWACVEAAYAWPERQTPVTGGRMAVVVAPGAQVTGLAELVASAAPSVLKVVGDAPFAADADRVASVEDLTGPFDDIVYAGAEAQTMEALGPKLAFHGLFNLVLGGATVDRDVSIDVGRIHYDLIRYVGTAGTEAGASYTRIPSVTEVRPGDRVAIIGAAGPMGLMHTIRTVVLDVPGVAVDAADVDDARLERLAQVAGPYAEANGVTLRVVNTTREPLSGPYDYVAVMVPHPGLLAQAVGLAGPGGIVNAFAGFAIGTTAALDVGAIAGRGV
jgi:threonine dehydrogenase-like Zn-dependent dehydrogenase